MEDFWDKVKKNQIHIAIDYCIAIMRELNEVGALSPLGKKLLEDLIVKDKNNRNSNYEQSRI